MVTSNPAKRGHPKTGQWRARQDNSSYSPNRPRASRLAFIAELRADDEGPESQIEVPRDRERKPRRPPPALQMAANIEIESSEANFNLSATSGFARTTVPAFGHRNASGPIAITSCNRNSLDPRCSSEREILIPGSSSSFCVGYSPGSPRKRLRRPSRIVTMAIL